VLSMPGDGRGWSVYLGFFPFFVFPPLFFPVFSPLITSCVALGCATVSLGSSWCFFWHLLAWLPALDGPHLQAGMWVRTWPLHDALSLAQVWGSMDLRWVWLVDGVDGVG